MKLQEFQNTVDSLIVLYRHWELLKSENSQCLEAIAILKKDEKMFLAEHDENVRLHFENVDLKEQNARLRKALTELAEPILKPEIYNGFDTTEAAINSFCNAVNSIASAALEGKE